jgi:RNA polymerase sigma-70 factor, ECF subfamily
MNQSRQKDATEQIWRELSDRLRRFVRLRIHAAADVDDVLQTVFLRIHAHIDELRKTDRVESWVFQITRNAVNDHFRRKVDVHADVESLAAESEEPDAGRVAAELSGCLAALIDRLPEDQRRALSLYELEGRSQKEIAIRESISVSGAKSRIQRGRKSLEAMLKACCAFQFDRRGNVVEYEAHDAGCCEHSIHQCGRPAGE